MAINFLNDVSFNKNEIIQPVLENQANDTAAGTPVDGQLYYDTTNNQVKYGEGSAWVALATGGGSVTSVALTETGDALTITGSPITGAGTINIAGAGSTSQYIRGDLTLATFPTIPTVNDATITLTMGDGLSSSGGSFTLNQSNNETFTFTVGEGTGITVATGSVGIDYAGSDNAILSASAATPVSADQLWFNDDGDNTIKRATIADIVALAPQGDITAITEGAGITVTNGTGPIPSIAVDYAGTDNVILEATDDAGNAVGTSDKIMTSNNSTNAVEYHNVSDLPFTNNAGDITGVTAGTYLSGGGSSGSVTINHDSTTRSDTTSSSSLSFGGTFDAVDSVSTNATGHVTAINVETFTMPSNPNTNETYTLPVAAGAANTAIINLTAGGSGSGIKSSVTFSGTANEIAVTESTGNNGSITIGLPDDVTIAGELTVSGTGQSSFAGQVTVPATPSASTDAASKGYVLSQVGGVGKFQGGYNASTNSPALTGGSNVALDQGDFYVVTTDGTFFSDTVEVGDFIFANNAIAASSTPSASDYTTVIADENIAGAASTDGATQKGVAGFNSAHFNVTANGWVSSDIYGGSSTLGIVPSGGSGSTFLRGDGTWQAANNYTLPAATATVRGGVELFSDTVQSTSANSVTTTASRTYGVQVNSAAQMVVNVPWSDTNAGGTVTSVGIAAGYIMDVSMNSGSNPITGAGQFLIDVDASELADMTQTITTSDEAFVLDVSETGKDQGKRKRWAEIISDLNLATGSIPTVNNSTITLSAGNFISGGGAFTLNQASNETITFNVDQGTASAKGAVIVAGTDPISVGYSSGTATVSIADSAAAQKGAVIVSGGTGIDVSYSSGTATVSQTSGSTGGFSGALTSATSGIARAEAGGVTTFTLTTATLFGAATNSRQCIVEVMDGTSYATVYPEVARAATTTIEVKFKGSVANDAYDISIVHAGSN